MRLKPLFHLARVRRDPRAAQGWSYASLCEAVPRAANMHGLTYNPDKTTCPQCLRWIRGGPLSASKAQRNWGIVLRRQDHDDQALAEK